MPAVSPEAGLDQVQNEGWLKRHKTKLAVGAAALSLALPLAFQPMSENKKLVTESGPWVATGLAASEAAWIGGAIIMLGAAGRKIRNPLKVRSSLDDIREVKGTDALRAGFAVHMTGAISQDAILAAAVLELPKASWGLMAIPAYFAASTGIRAVAMWPALKKPGSSNALEGGV